MTSDSSEGLHLVQQSSGEATGRIRRSVWMLEEIHKSLQLVPDEAERHFSLALLEVILGRFDNSIKNLERAIQVDPEHMPSLSLLGELHLKMGDHKKAATLLEQVVSREPDNMTAITWLCLAYHCLGFKGKALAQQSILQSIAPDLIVTVLNK
jgi:tetratricopeptide (TPR) repeat protein